MRHTTYAPKVMQSSKARPLIVVSAFAVTLISEVDVRMFGLPCMRSTYYG